MGEVGRVREGAGKQSLGQTSEELPPAAVGSVQFEGVSRTRSLKCPPALEWGQSRPSLAVVSAVVGRVGLEGCAAQPTGEHLRPPGCARTVAPASACARPAPPLAA